MKLHTHSLIMISASISESDQLNSKVSSEMRHMIAQRCDEVAQDVFYSSGDRITSSLSETGVLTVLSSDGTSALAATALFVNKIEAKSRPTQIHLKVAIHIIDAAESSMASAADARFANQLRFAAHGGQILLSARAHSALHQAMPSDLSVCDLGQHQMPDLSQPDHVFQLLSTQVPHVFPPIHSLSGGRHNLLSPVSRLIGRDSDMLALRDLLRSERTVSLVGCPGIGKTRLAVQTAAVMVEEMAEGAWFIEIPLLDDPSLVVPAVAAALKVSEDPSSSLLDSIVATLVNKQALLVFDNCDLVRRACATTIETIVGSCPHICILATATEPIGVHHEAIQYVRPLVLPDTASASTASGVRTTEAGELFNDFATTASPEFVLTHANAPSVARLINATCGIPYALQVAAHTVRVLDVESMANELEARVSRIVTGSDASLHAVMRSVVEWSYNQLTPACQAVLNRLSVMTGSFTQAALNAVAPGGRESARMHDAGPTVDMLIASGLVTARQQSGVPRYRLPDAVREFVHSRLDAGERLRARKRYADYYLSMAEDACKDLDGTKAARMALWLEKEYSNLCAALAWCQEDPDQASTGVRLATALRKYWEARGYPGEGQALLLSATVYGDRGHRTTARADALKKAGDAAFQGGNYSASRARHQEALSINRDLGDRPRQAINLNNLGNVARAEGDHAAAQSMHEEALAINREIGDQRREAVNLHNIGNALRDQGDFDGARAYYEEAIGISLKMGDDLGIGHNLNSLARLALSQNNRREALRLYEEALTHFKKAKSQAWVAHNLTEIEKFNLRSSPLQECDVATA